VFFAIVRDARSRRGGADELGGEGGGAVFFAIVRDARSRRGGADELGGEGGGGATLP